jgi:hypothetical protein
MPPHSERSEESSAATLALARSASENLSLASHVYGHRGDPSLRSGYMHAECSDTCAPGTARHGSTGSAAWGRCGAQMPWPGQGDQ